MVVAATPEAISFPQLEAEESCRQKADKLIHLAGLAALTGTEGTLQATRPKTLYEAINLAAEGDKTSEKMVRTNIHTDVFERTIKAGFVLSVRLEENEYGQTMQNGQTNEQIQLNTIRYLSSNAKMQPRFHAETRNTYRFEAAKKLGLLEDYNFVVISRCADDMTDAELEHNGFFVPTKSLAVQSTGISAGEIETESAFMAGVKSRGESRHDSVMVARFGRRVGVDLDKNAAETIDMPLLIPKKMMPNGVVDVVRMLDDENGGTFFGEDKPREDYATFRESCRQREREMQPTVDKIYQELIASRGELFTPLDATTKLGKLSGKYTIEYAVGDDRIDARVFGEAAAWRLQDARAQFEVGDMQRAKLAMRAAARVERSSSCPGGAKTAESDIAQLNGDAADTKEDALEDCDFVSKACPKCGAKNVKTRCRGGKYYGECGCHS